MGSEDNVVRFVIGVFVSLGASFMDALGLNILKLDHVKEAKRDKEHQRGDCGRPLWHMGLYTYIASQLIGSTIALSKWLRKKQDTIYTWQSHIRFFLVSV